MALIIAVDNLFRTHGLTASSEETARPARNLLTGRRDTFWVATSAVEQTVMLDTGLGNTATVDYVALTHADRLAAVAAAVHVEWSADAVSSWTTVGAPFPLAPILTSHLLAPASQDYFTTVASTAKRAWRIRLAGTLTGPPSLAGVALGVHVSVGEARYGGGYSRARNNRGGDLMLEWPLLSEVSMQTLLTTLAAASPEYPGESPTETMAGGAWGGRSHYLYDASGRLNRAGQAGTPALFHVVLLTPGLAPTYELPAEQGAPAWHLPAMTWRELVG